MARYVIDAPTLLRLVADDIAVHPAHQLVAPNLIRSQALDLLFQAVRRGELTDAAALQLHEKVTGLKVRLLGDRVSRGTAWRMAREQDWTSIIDAEYFAVTRLQADAFVTVDPEMARAASIVVPVAPFEALLTE